jgi:hypothetical protein
MGSNDAAAAAEHKFQIYDADKGTFLGRTGGSWLKITVFYIAYFAFLAGLFTASVQLMQSQLPEDKPKLNTRLNIPGLHYFPKFSADNKDHKKRLGNNDGITFYWKGADGEAGYNYYVTETQKVLKTYEADASNGKDFSLDTLGECSPAKDATYGWSANQPCIYFRLNRVIDWQPVGLFKPEEGTYFAQKNNGPTKPMVRDATYVRCQAKDENNEIISSEDGALFQYFGGATDGGDGYFPADFFPYKGKKADGDNFESPVVAVKVVGLEEGKLYKVECQAHARNIIIDAKANLGSIKFEVQNGGK